MYFIKKSDFSYLSYSARLPCTLDFNVSHREGSPEITIISMADGIQMIRPYGGS